MSEGASGPSACNEHLWFQTKARWKDSVVGLCVRTEARMEELH